VRPRRVIGVGRVCPGRFGHRGALGVGRFGQDTPWEPGVATRQWIRRRFGPRSAVRAYHRSEEPPQWVGPPPR
jgi:hypothetical protein